MPVFAWVIIIVLILFVAALTAYTVKTREELSSKQSKHARFGPLNPSDLGSISKKAVRIDRYRFKRKIHRIWPRLFMSKSEYKRYVKARKNLKQLRESTKIAREEKRKIFESL